MYIMYLLNEAETDIQTYRDAINFISISTLNVKIQHCEILNKYSNWLSQF